MNFAKRLLMVAGAVALAGIFGALLAPKTAHGVVATLVQVVNDSAHPVLNRNIDRAENEPFIQTLCMGNPASPGFFPCFDGGTGSQSFVVPGFTTDGKSVKELVIEFVDGGCSVAPSTPGIVLVALSTSVGSGGLSHIFPFSQNPTFTAPEDTHNFFWATPTRFYADPGTTSFFNVVSSTNFSCTMNVSGYLATQ